MTVKTQAVINIIKVLPPFPKKIGNKSNFSELAQNLLTKTNFHADYEYEVENGIKL